ncbi:MAG: MoaD/ThiS family protein [Deltaproteobacteria bacterium]|nr:MoaD/ThiS family protein [Deltaproteobacteria bacterium]
MVVTIKLPSVFAALAEDQKRIQMDLDGETFLESVLDLLAGKYPELKQAAGIGQGDIPDHVNVYHNGDNVRYLQGLKTPLRNGDTVQIIPAVAAG